MGKLAFLLSIYFIVGCSNNNNNNQNLVLEVALKQLDLSNEIIKDKTTETLYELQDRRPQANNNLNKKLLYEIALKIKEGTEIILKKLENLNVNNEFKWQELKKEFNNYTSQIIAIDSIGSKNPNTAIEIKNNLSLDVFNTNPKISNSPLMEKTIISTIKNKIISNQYYLLTNLNTGTLYCGFSNNFSHFSITQNATHLKKGDTLILNAIGFHTKYNIEYEIKTDGPWQKSLNQEACIKSIITEKKGTYKKEVFVSYYDRDSTQKNMGKTITYIVEE